MEVLGTPLSLTVIASGLDLILIAGGLLNLEISKAGSGRFRLGGIQLRTAFIPGVYRLARGRYCTVHSLIFQGVLLSERSVVLGSPGRQRYAASRRNQS